MAVDVYEKVTNEMIKMLEQGIIPWHRPWKIGSTYNIVSYKNYSLLNTMLLDKPGAYATFKQWGELGGKIKKGEKSKMIIFWKLLKAKDNKEDEEGNQDTENENHKKEKFVPFLRYINVFHISQVEGLDEKIINKAKAKEMELLDFHSNTEVEEVMNLYYDKYNIKLIHSGTEAYYNSALDKINLPKKETFISEQEYYSTLFHETVHSTGHASRLARNIRNKFGSDEYAAEELVAEIGSASLMKIFDIETKDTFKNSAAYIQSWVERFKEDKKMIVFSACKSEKAVNLILDKNDNDETENEDVA